MRTDLPLGYNVRLGRIIDVQNSYVTVERIDRRGESPIRCPIPHPYAGKGGGLFVGIEKDTLCLLSKGMQEEWFIVAIIPDNAFYSDIGGATGIRSHETSYPSLSEGEIIMKGNLGQKIGLLKDGNISIDAGIGDQSADIELSNFAKALFLRTNNIYQFTEAGRSIEGIIKRDLNTVEEPDTLGGIDFLAGEGYEELLEEIGRSPKSDIHNRTTVLVKPTTRNPPLIEKRDIIYEYAHSFDVQGFDKEVKAIIEADPQNIDESIDSLVSDAFFRKNRRTDVLNLNLTNYNHLIEKVQGTLVDIYGNILDINRNIINVPPPTKDRKDLKVLYDYLRRSVKYHFEINSRKDIFGTEAGLSANDISGVMPKHSRFSVDIDAEGFTKINIPSTSESGNIPILSRYFTSRGDANSESGTFKDDKNRDIRIAQFGAKKTNSDDFAGQDISAAEYRPPSILSSSKKTSTGSNTEKKVTVGTAYHDLLNIANSIFTNGKFKNTDPAADASTPIASKINNKILGKDEKLEDIPEEDRPNAGGKSLHINMDGSLEMSIGADTVDRKSLVMDLAGGTISHFGRDKNGRSIIHQSDGDVLIQVGGKGVVDPRFNDTSDKPGRLEIHLNRPNSSPQIIIIDENGITINVQGNAVYSSTGDTTISSGGKLLLHGESIYMYGTHDSEIDGTRATTNPERYVQRNGRTI